MDTLLAEALQHLPHGPSFRFLDRLLQLDPGKSGSGEYRVRGDEPFLAGHFPGHPLFPGVLLIEAVAQLVGVIAQTDPNHPALSGLKLTAVRSLKILGTARPGELLRLEAQISGRMDNLVQGEVRAHVGDRVILEGLVTLSGDKAPR